MVVSAAQEISKKHDLLSSMYCCFFVIYPIASAWYLACAALEGSFGGTSSMILGKTGTVFIFWLTVPLIVGYCITEAVMLCCCRVWNTSCAIIFRTFISIHDLILIIACIQDWKNVYREKELFAIFAFVFCITLAINCTILYTIARFPRKGSAGNLLSAPTDNTE